MLFTPHTSDSSKISPFHLHVATSKPPAREIFACLGLARARGWREEFGVECYSPASSGRVPASGDTRPREHGQAVPWELARPGRRLGRVCSGQSHGGAWEQGPSPSQSWALPSSSWCWTGSLSHNLSHFLQGQKPGKITWFCLGMVGLMQGETAPKSQPPAAHPNPYP